jgi:hypothetical protein
MPIYGLMRVTFFTFPSSLPNPYIGINEIAGEYGTIAFGSCSGYHIEIFTTALAFSMFRKAGKIWLMFRPWFVRSRVLFAVSNGCPFTGSVQSPRIVTPSLTYNGSFT